MEGGGGSNAAHICWLQQKPHRVSLMGKKTTTKTSSRRIRIRHSEVLTNETNIKWVCVCMLLRVYVIKSVCLKTHHPGVDTVAVSNLDCSTLWTGCLYHLRLEIAFVVPVLTIPLGHYILQSHPQLIFENKKHILQKMPKDDKKWSFHHKSGENKQVWSRQNFLLGREGAVAVSVARVIGADHVNVWPWRNGKKERDPDSKASWIK